MDFFGHHIEFEYSGWLSVWPLALGLMVAVCCFGFLSMRAMRNAYAHAENLNRTTRALTFVSALFQAGCYGGIAVLMCIALAEPFEPNAPTVVPEGTIHLAGSFDVSPSMAAEDYREILPTPVNESGEKAPPIGPWGSRLHMAKWLFLEQVMKALPGNKIGLSTYTADPWPQAPLGGDYGTLRFMLSDTGWIGIGSAPGGGSDYIQGMKIAVHTLRRDYDPKMRQIIVLFTDGGVDFDSEEEKAKWNKEYTTVVEEVKALKAEVIIVGLGSNVPQQVPIYHPDTLERIDWWPFRQEKKETTAIDEPALIALRDRLQASGVPAKFVRVPTEGDAALGIDWVATVGGTKQTMGKQTLTKYPVLLAMGLFALLMLRGLRRRDEAVVRRPVRR